MALVSADKHFVSIYLFYITFEDPKLGIFLFFQIMNELYFFSAFFNQTATLDHCKGARLTQTMLTNVKSV